MVLRDTKQRTASPETRRITAEDVVIRMEEMEATAWESAMVADYEQMWRQLHDWLGTR